MQELKLILGPVTFACRIGPPAFPHTRHTLPVILE